MIGLEVKVESRIMVPQRVRASVKWAGHFFWGNSFALLLAFFISLVVLWAAAWFFPETVWERIVPGRFARNLGYAALIAFLFPYLHIARRFFLNRRVLLKFIPLGNLKCWLWWHMGGACLAFLFTLGHSKAHAGNGLTLAILILFWAVMISGIVGFFGTKAFYRLLALMNEREVGLERIADERSRLALRAEVVVRNHSLLREEHISHWPGFCAKILQGNPVLAARLSLDTGSKTVIKDALQTGNFPSQLQAEIIEKINKQLQKPQFCGAKDFLGLAAAGEGPRTTDPRTTEASDAACAPRGHGREERLAEKVAYWAQNEPASEHEVEKRNRLFLEALCPAEIVESVPPPEAVVPFFAQARIYLRTGYPAWGWLFSPQALEPVAQNHYLRVRELSMPEQRQGIDEIWEIIQNRRQLDLEYCFHRLTRVWLLVHGPAAWALLVLVLAHVWSSIYFGGWF